MKKTTFYVVGSNINLESQEKEEPIIRNNNRGLPRLNVSVYELMSIKHKKDISLAERKNSWRSNDRKIFLDKKEALKYAQSKNKYNFCRQVTDSPIVATVEAYPKLLQNGTLT